MKHTKTKSMRQKNDDLTYIDQSPITFSKKDFLSIIDATLKHRYGREEFFLKQLNSLLSTCFLFSKISIDRQTLHGKRDLKKDLSNFQKALNKFRKILKKINEHGSVLYFLNDYDKSLQGAEILVSHLHNALPTAMKNLSNSKGRKTGKSTRLHETILLRDLIVIYQHYTRKDAENNFALRLN